MELFGRKPFLVCGVVALWGCSILMSFSLLERYKNRPGEGAAALSEWPSGSVIPLSPDRPTLIIFAHPRCPCSKASLAELDALLTDYRSKVSVRVAFYQPTSKTEEWAKTPLWNSAIRSGATVSLDADGSEARRFGAKTSGQVFLYSSSGKLLFSGGITGARGHIGDNAGHRALASAIDTGEPSPGQAKVFGCTLFHDGHPVNALEEREDHEHDKRP